MLSAHCGQQVGQRGALPPQAVSNSSFFLQPEHKEPPSLRSPQALPRFPPPGLPFESNQWRHPHPAGRPGSICKTKIEDPPFKSYAAGRPHTPDSHQYSTAKTKWTQKQRVTSPGPWPSGPRPLLLLQEAKMGMSGNQTSPVNCSGNAAPGPGCGQCRYSPPWPGPPVRARSSLVCLDNLCLPGHLSLWPPETNGDKLMEIMVGRWAGPKAHERGAHTSHSGNYVQGGGRTPSGRRSWAWAPGCSGARGKVHIQPAGSPAQSCPQAIQDTGGCPPALGPTCKPCVVTRLKGRLRSLQGEKHDFWSQCGEKHEKTAASSLKNFLKKQGQDIDSSENSLTSSSPATPQRPAYSHNKPMTRCSTSLIIRGHKSTAQQDSLTPVRTNTVKTRNQCWQGHGESGTQGHHCQGSQDRGSSRSRQRTTVRPGNFTCEDVPSRTESRDLPHA